MLGFGRQMTWTSDLVVPPGHKMTFKDALHILSTNLLQKIIIPDWLKPLMKQSRNVELAFRELKVCYPKSSQLYTSNSCLIFRAAIHAGNGGSSQKWG